MPQDIIASYLSNSNFTLTSLNLGQVSTNGIAVLAVKIKLESKLFRNQREDGSYIVDGRILLPTSVDAEVVVQSKSAVDTVNRILKDRSTIYTINTRGLIFNNMVCVNEQITQNAENLSSSPFHLVFREILLQEEATPKTMQDADSTALDRGIAYLKETTNTVTNLVTDIKNKITGFF